MAQSKVMKNQIMEGVIWKQLLVFCFPIILGTLFQQMYNAADVIVVGHFVGKEALACVGGSSGTVINLVVGFFVGLSSGATVIVSRAYGAGVYMDAKGSGNDGYAAGSGGRLPDLSQDLFCRYPVCVYLQYRFCYPAGHGGFQEAAVLSDRLLCDQHLAGCYPCGRFPDGGCGGSHSDSDSPGDQRGADCPGADEAGCGLLPEAA